MLNTRLPLSWVNGHGKGAHRPVPLGPSAYTQRLHVEGLAAWLPGRGKLEGRGRVIIGSDTVCDRKWSCGLVVVLYRIVNMMLNNMFVSVLTS